MFNEKQSHNLSRFFGSKKQAEDVDSRPPPEPNDFSRRSLIKGAAGVAISVLIGDRFAYPGAAVSEFIPYDPTRDAHYGYRRGWIEHHRPSSDSAAEQFVFVRLKYPGGDWYTNIVDWYRGGFGKPSDVKFTEVLAQETSIDVELHEHAQYVSIDDSHIFNYPYLHMTGHMGCRFSDGQAHKLREYLERGGFLHVED